MSKQILIKFGQKIREERNRLGISQEELAARVGLMALIHLIEHCSLK